MKGILVKPEPIWYETVTDDGKKLKVRKLKLSILVDIVDFADALSYDGATMDVFRPDEMATPENGKLNKRILEFVKTLNTVTSDLIRENEEA